jgi:hypothetical protein
VIGSEGEHRKLQSLWRNYRTIHEVLLAKTGFPVFASVSNTNDRMAHAEVEVLAYIRVNAHEVCILNILAFPDLIV